MRVKPRERMIRSCGLPVRNGSLKRACDETGCSHLHRPVATCLSPVAGVPPDSIKQQMRPISHSCWPITFEAGRGPVRGLAVFFWQDGHFSCSRSL